MKIDDTLKKLQSGNLNFVNDNLSNGNQDSTRRSDVVSGQNPFAAILTCSDSRVVPELIFNTGIGELFVIRVAGNIANTSTIASIEYAVAHLDVTVVVVLGHQNCGAVTSALSDENGGQNIDHLLKFIEPAINASTSKTVEDVSTIHSKLTVNKLLSDSLIISDAVNKSKIKVVPAFYSLETGIVNFIE